MSTQGLKPRLTSSGIPVLRLHYSASPDKRPGTPEGDVWLKKALIGYSGGLKNPRWQKEMEIQYGALGGTRLFPEWEQWCGLGRIIIHPFEPEGYKLYGSYDHGWRNPASYHVHGINGDGNIVTLWEIYGSHIAVTKMADAIKGNDITLPDGRRYHGNPWPGRESFKIADPSIYAEDQPMSDGTNKSIAELFRREGVYFTKGERGGDTMVAEWLHGHFWKDPQNPLYRITTDCPKLIWEIGQQRHKEFSAKVALNRDQPEELVDKDNHAWDDLKYFLKRFPPKPQPKKEVGKPGTFNWWKREAKDGTKRNYQRTFRI